MCQNHDNNFVHLHCHSEFSLLDGLSRIDEMVARAAEMGQPAIALTDHGTMYGTMPFYEACKKHGVKSIIGLETYMAARGMEDRDAKLDKERCHMLLLAQNQTGYLNLLEIATASQLKGYYYKPRINRKFLASYGDGLIGTTGCLAAEIPQALMHGRTKEADRLMGEYLDIFSKDRFFIELQEHSIPELTEVNKQLIAMAPRFGLENNFLATNDVHYTRAEDADPHQVLLCIQTGSTLANPKMTFSDKDYYLKNYAEMFHLFNGYEENLIKNSLHNSLLIADMCDVNLDTEGYHLPLFDVPEGFDAHTYLRHLCQKGLVWRYGEQRAQSDDVLKQRLEHELGIINRMGFDTYFLIVWDLCEWAARSDEWWRDNRDPFPFDNYEDWKRNDIWWNVRGSGAGSVVAYTLGITSIDPLKNALIFERFLNPGRLSMPDIDLDYPDDVRGLMVSYTKRRYGSEKVAQIITFGTMKARAAIRDVGRALDMPLPDVDSVVRLIPAIPGKNVKIKDVFNDEHEFYNKELVDRYRQEPVVKELIDTAKQMEGLVRHASSHAAGVIVSDAPLQKYVPLNRPTSGDAGLGGVDRVTQWPMEIVEGIGLLKVDFLGLSTLTVMRRAARIIEERYGTRYTMDNIPYDADHVGPDPEKDPNALFQMLARGEVAGVFQVEGAGMRRLMMEMKPARYDHIIAAISLYRPGPMENIPEYIRRMHSDIYDDKDIVEYHTPALEPILKDTYGIIVYQEQIIRIATDLAGYEPGPADLIRKAVAKKKKKLMEEHQKKFTAGALDNGHSQQAIDAIWGDIEFFARYGFNKAHAADYAKVTCQTAFLKAHYKVEYLTAMLSVERDKTEKVQRYFAEAKALGIDVGAPDVNLSDIDFTIEDPADENDRSIIRFGLGAIKNAGEGAIQNILDERKENGTFDSIQDLCERVDLRRVGKRSLEYLIKAGAMTRFGTVQQLLDGLDRMVNYSGNQHDAASAGQMSLFGGALAAVTMEVDLLRSENELKKEFREADYRKVLEWEKEALGVYVSEHPLERPLNKLKGLTNTVTTDVDVHWNSKQVRIAGMISQLRPLTTKKGDPMAFAKFEDLHGDIDLVFFPRTWAAHRHEVAVDQIMLVFGKVQADERGISVLVDSVKTTVNIHSAASEPGGSQTSLNLPTPEPEWEAAPGSESVPPPDDDFDDDDNENDNEDGGMNGVRPLPESAARVDFAARSNGSEPTDHLQPHAASNGNGNGHHAPALAPHETTSASPKNGHDQLAPNQNGVEKSAQEPVANGKAAQEPSPAVTSSAEEAWDHSGPPPPPNFDDDWDSFEPAASYEEEVEVDFDPLIASPQSSPQRDRQNGDGSAYANGARNGTSPPPAKPVETTPSFSRAMTEPVPKRDPILISVEVSTTQNWRATCRRLVEIACRNQGPDKFTILLVDQNLQLDFPNCRPRLSDALISQLSAIEGVVHIEQLALEPA